MLKGSFIFLADLSRRLTIPRSVWVVIGPFIGWKGTLAGSSGSGRGMLLADIGMSGSPRFHDSPSMSPKTWQLAQDASPLPEVSRAL